MSSRSIDDLHALFKPKALAFVEAARAAGLDVLIYCTYRSPEEQSELYTHGRTAPGPIVTNARAGQSAHNFGLAFDGVPMIHGKPMWDEKHPSWDIYGTIATYMGLDWAGNWVRFREYPHVEFPKWKTVAGVP